MKIYFNKGTAAEKSLDLDYFNENVMNKRAGGYLNRPVSETSVFPDVSDFPTTFNTLHVYTGSGVELPVQVEYNTIVDLSTHYDDKSGVWGLNLTLGVAENA